MLVYRISKERYIKDLSGKGAELAGGRWNPKGKPALYTSSSLALCICEVLVHTDKDIPPQNMCYAQIFIPDECISDEYYSSDSESTPLELGTKWLNSASALAIKVHSIIMPKDYDGDFNIIINPLHKDFDKVTIKNVAPCNFDNRLF